jgi:hypothetical protein
VLLHQCIRLLVDEARIPDSKALLQGPTLCISSVHLVGTAVILSLHPTAHLLHEHPVSPGHLLRVLHTVL